ncbi:transcription factor Adf-1-like [Schistocerca piceifrons]|uniref:transcription factor Adf-1-like n=1 Tax=Schistocerca piceifrons TaxID=274613 RepID=UPI001F5F4C73|nr:transcription factor Adf-1-like [Schistocerca piceifrons]
MEQLIEEVRTHPVIWDSTLEVYRDVTLKEKAWNEIAELLSKDKNSLRNQWRKLRDCHRQALNRRRTMTGQAANKIKKWKYEDDMKFVLKTMMHRLSDSNIPCRIETRN